MKGTILIRVATVFLLGVVTLLLTNTRVLVHETKVNPGEMFFISDYGDVGGNSQASLVCRYFSGRGILTKVFWYSTNNIFGKDQCPFIDRGE